MSTADESQGVVEPLFRLESIAPTSAPEGSDGVWYRYVIAQGANIITGMRSGSRSEIDLLVQQMVDQLNERAGKKQAKARR